MEVGPRAELSELKNIFLKAMTIRTSWEEEKFKFIDDLSMLEIINLVSVGIASYNFKAHVASDIAVDNYYLSIEKTKTTNNICSI